MGISASLSGLKRTGYFAGIFLAAVGAVLLCSQIERWITVTHAVGEPRAMSYSDFLTITLTALCALLAALAIILGGAAIWGYSGIKEALTQEVKDKADKALQTTLSKYPDARDVLKLFQDMQDLHEKQKRLSNQLVSESSSDPVARASKRDEDSGKAAAPLAREYPGKGNDDGDDNNHG